ncbi:retrovirus-related pol polyprotein from transposon TNT 1-94 [Tanacetum coccineum]
MLFLITITPRRFDSRQSDYTCNRPIGEATLVPPLDPSPSSTTNKVEVPKEFPKVSMVNTSLKELKRHLAGFDQVVKERTTATAITEGHRGGFELLSENERLLAQAIDHDIVKTVVNLSVNDGCETVNGCQKCLELKTELLNKKDVVDKETYDKLLRFYNSYQNAPSFTQLFKLSELRAESQENDTFIVKLKEQIKSLKGNVDDSKVKMDMDEIETLNIELEHRVTKLVAENEHLKHTYKQLYDLIKPKRVQSKEQCDALIKQVNIKSGKIFYDFNAKHKKKGLIETHSVDPKVSKDNVEPIMPKLLNKRTAHSSYIKHTQEEAFVLRDIVEHVKANYPQDSLKSAFREIAMPSDNLCVSNSMNDVKFRAKPKKKKSKKEIWKPTGKVFTIVGNACPLTRITTTNEVPSRKPIVLESESPKPVVNLVYSRKPRKNKNTESVSKTEVVQIVLWYLDSGCSKHMTGDRSQLTNFISKFLGTVKFRNDQVAKIMGYGDYQIGNVTISRVYYIEGLGHNLFFVGQFCDSNLEVAFRQHTCFIRNLEGVDLLTGSRGDNLYTLSLGNMMASSPICLLSKASKTKSWLWHRRLSHLNFGAINHLARHGLVRGLPKLKFEKDHLCSACALGKSSKKPYKPKSEDTNKKKLYLLHMDLCGPMRVASVNGKNYILVIVDDYSRFTWLKETVCRIRTDNGTGFVNQTLREYYEKVGFSHETSVARSPQQNGVVERRNRTLIEAARTMLIYAKALLFLWAEAVTTACYIQNHSMIRRCHDKTPYELLHDKPPDLSYLHVFGALCHPTNDCENLGKLQPKADIGIFIGYAPTKKAFLIYNRRTRRIIETIL